MKRLTVFILLMLTVFTLASCSNSKPVYPVSYHYLHAYRPNGEIFHGSTDSVIAPEIREGDPYQDNVALLLDIYLHGPRDTAFRSPFPVGTSLKSLTVDGTHAKVELSRSFSNQSGIDLSLSCACLTLTVMELTGVESVTISADGALLDGKVSITMDRSNMILADTATPETE